MADTMNAPKGPFDARVTCPRCALHDNTTVACKVTVGLLGWALAKCPVCGHSERVRPK